MRLVRLALARSARWAYFERSLYSVCAVCVDARVGDADGAEVRVDVAVGIHVGVAAFFISRVNIGMRVDVFVCFGRLRLLLVGSRRRVLAWFKHMVFITNEKCVIAKRSRSCTCIGKPTCRIFFNVGFNLTSAAQLLVARLAAQPLQRSELMLVAFRFIFSQALDFLRHERAGYAAATWLPSACSCACVRMHGCALVHFWLFLYSCICLIGSAILPRLRSTGCNAFGRRVK